MTTHHTNPLTWRIFVAPPEPIVGDDLEPGQSRRTRSPISATLISGERDAVLVDPLLSFKQGHALAGLVVATGKNLTPCISPMVMATTGWDSTSSANVSRTLEPSRCPLSSNTCGCKRRLSRPRVVSHSRTVPSAPPLISCWWEPARPSE